MATFSPAPHRPPPTREDVLLLSPASRRPAIVFLSILGAFTAVAVGLLIVRSVFFGPDDAVRDYFTALQARDAVAARETLASTGGSGLLAAAVVSNAGYVPPADAEISEVVRSDDTSAVVTATYTLAGGERTVQFSLAREDAAPTRVFPKWRITNATYDVNVLSPFGTSVVIAGQSYPLSQGQFSSRAFLGTYTAQVPDTVLLTAQPRSIVPGSAGSYQFSPAIRPGVQEVVDQQISSWITTCAQSTTLEPPGCPFSYGTYGDASNISWAVTSQPQYDLTVEGGEVFVESEVEGQVRVSWNETSFYGTVTPGSDDFGFTVEGYVVEQNGQPLFQSYSF